MGQGGTPGRQQSLPKTFHQSWRHRQLHGFQSRRTWEGVLVCVSIPVLESLVLGGCSQVRPILGGLFSPSVCSISVSVFSPGTLDLSTEQGHEFCAPAPPERRGSDVSLYPSGNSSFSILRVLNHVDVLGMHDTLVIVLACLLPIYTPTAQGPTKGLVGPYLICSVLA